MIIKDIRKDFFDLLQYERILVVANLDVDSVCAVKILQSLLQCDNVQYVLEPVVGKSDLIRAFEDNTGEDSGVRYVVMINCGATIDLVDFLSPPEDLIIFVADSHRPIDVCNAYSDGQIRLITASEEEEDIPEYGTIFRDESDDNEETGGSDEYDEDDADDDHDENVNYGNKKRRRYDEKSIMKRRNRRIWEDKRAKILFDYQQFSFVGPSTAVLMYELAWKMSRDDNDLLWWSIIGHTEQFVMLKSEDDKYLIGSGNLRDHVSRLNITTSSSSEGENSRSIGCMKLKYQKELNLHLYRHWSISESLHHTIYTAAKFKIWTHKGKQKLSEFLAELGLPLVQVKQKFATMDLGIRTEVCSMFEEKREKYSIDEITYNSFVASFGFRHKFCAADVVFAVLALLEQLQEAAKLGAAASNVSNVETSGEAPPNQNATKSNFLEALKSLSRPKIDILEGGIERAKEKLGLVMRQVQTFLDLRTIVCAGPFLYAVIQEGTPDSNIFGHPNWLALLAHATLRAHVTVSGGKKTQNLPLVLSAPLDTTKGTCLILGVPPVTDRRRKNLLGKAFEQAAKRTSSRYLLDYFDGSVIQLRSEDSPKFFEGLVSLLSL